MTEREMEAIPELVSIGRVRRAHGTRGVLVIEMLTPSAAEVLVPGRRAFAGSVQGGATEPVMTLHVELAEPFQDGLRVQFAEIRDKDTADLWRGRYLMLPVDELPETDGSELDPADLVGLTVERRNGDVVGMVEAYYELRHDLLIEVTRPEGSVLIPFRDEFIDSVDFETGKVTVNPPDGLL